MYIVSGCLLGYNCRYDGGSKPCKGVIDFAENHSCIRVCPEMAAKLPCPRPPAEIVGDRVLNREGKDVTKEFEAGARLEYERALKKAQESGEKIEGAILKAHSPSCGKSTIYDGSFAGKLTSGDGCFTRLLKENGIDVITEKEITKW